MSFVFETDELFGKAEFQTQRLRLLIWLDFKQWCSSGPAAQGLPAEAMRTGPNMWLLWASDAAGDAHDFWWMGQQIPGVSFSWSGELS